MIISVIIGFTIIIRVLLSDKAKEKPIVFLNLFLLFFTLNNLQIVLLDNFFTEANFFQHNLLLPFYSLIVPFFYAFIIHYLQVEKKIKSYLSIISSK